MEKNPKYRRIVNLNNKPDVMPCWRSGFEFWGKQDPKTGHIVEDVFNRIHLADEVILIG
jgi:predicted aconitase with swiveling domain